MGTSWRPRGRRRRASSQCADATPASPRRSMGARANVAGAAAGKRGSNLAGDFACAREQLAVRDPQDAVARELQLAVAGAVLLEGGACRMRGVAVELDDEAGVRPLEVHFGVAVRAELDALV